MAIQNIYQLESTIGQHINTYLSEIESINTRKAYQSDIAKFIKGVFNKSISTITKSEIETVDYHTIIEYRKTLNNAASTINRNINSVKQMLTYLNSLGIIDIDLSFFNVIKELKKQTEEIPHMPISVAYEFIEAAKEERFHGNLKSNLIMFALDTGLRQEEILKIKLSDFTKTEHGYMYEGYGKGNKKFKDTISEQVYDKIVSTYNKNKKELLFYPLTSKNLRDMMKRIRVKLGYEKEGYSFHSLRKTAITYVHDYTGDIVTAQRKANHSNLNTTTIYIENKALDKTGLFSTQSEDKELYKKVSHEDLLESLEDMPIEFLQILNNKLKNNSK